MDVQMPRLDGLGASRVIREKEREHGGRTPIVAMTAHAHKDDEENCLAAGMDAYISKPIDFKKSLQVIGDIIKQTATPLTASDIV
jgi:CheY-like chemotaxis protein